MGHRRAKAVAAVRFLGCAILSAVPLAALAEDDVLERGRQVFTTEAEPNCAVCHTLADAQAEGEVGPNLDDLRPTEEEVRAAVIKGVEAMPAYEDVLTPEQIDAVAAYVAGIAGTKR